MFANNGPLLPTQSAGEAILIYLKKEWKGATEMLKIMCFLAVYKKSTVEFSHSKFLWVNRKLFLQTPSRDDSALYDNLVQSHFKGLIPPLQILSKYK